MPQSTAKAHRCESCGAGLPEGKSTCDYCGSHHDLPAYRPDSPLTAPSPPAASGAALFRIALVLTALLIAAAVASSFYW